MQGRWANRKALAGGIEEMLDLLAVAYVAGQPADDSVRDPFDGFADPMDSRFDHPWHHPVSALSALQPAS